LFTVLKVYNNLHKPFGKSILNTSMIIKEIYKIKNTYFFFGEEILINNYCIFIDPKIKYNN